MNTPTPNPSDLPTCTCANLRKAMRVVTQAFDTALKPSGLKATQFTVLATLAGRGDLPLTKLAEALVMERTTLTRNLKPLVTKEWVRIEAEADQRVRRVHLTKAGQRTLDTARPLWAEAQSHITSGLGEQRWAGLLDDLSATVDIVQGS